METMSEDKYIEIFIKNVSEVLKKRDRSMRWLSLESELNGSTVFRVLKGQIKPSLNTCVQISNSLGVSLQWLFTEHKGNLKIPEKSSNTQSNDFNEVSDRLDVIDKKLDLVISLSNQKKAKQ